MALSPEMADYFSRLEEKLQEAIGIASIVRKKGFDPRDQVEIPVAKDLAERVEALLGYSGLAGRIRELEKEMSREQVALRLGDDFVRKRFGETEREEILDHAIRAAMALLTEGVVSAPTEGIAKVGIGRNDDGSEYLKIYYAGPIRSAGGTAQALSVLVGDYVRQGLGLNRYIPRKEEIERYIEEIRQYNSITSLQYLPSERELRTIISNCPVCVDGEGTEREEVGGYRNLERVDTNVIRGGMALVVAEGLALKAPKIQKNVTALDIRGWEWLDGLILGAAKSDDEDGDEHGIKPRDKYLRDLIAGRPVFSYPMRKGGFRLRLGRSRNTGFAAAGLNPATLHILGDFLAVGTQMKIERPGKAAGIVPVDSIEGPTVRLNNGDVLRIDTVEEALGHMDDVDEILDVGEVLISFGEFMENNHPLVPPAYCHEWWILEGGKKRPENEMEAISIALDGVPLHPDYTYIWDDLDTGTIRDLAEWISANGRVEGGSLILPHDHTYKGILEELLVPHRLRDGKVIPDDYMVLLGCLGLDLKLNKRSVWNKPTPEKPLDLVSMLSGFTIRSRAGTRIGGRMGRPGKSKRREMSPPPHVLFPLGEAGGSRRSFQAASDYKIKNRNNHEGIMSDSSGGVVEVKAGLRACSECGERTFKNICRECGAHTEPIFFCTNCSRETSDQRCPKCGNATVCSQKIEINIRQEFNLALKNLNINNGDVPLLKGVQGLISRERAVEFIEKGILRSRHDLYVFKDGTVRYDMIDLPLTHFKPCEIGISVEKTRELGYSRDIYGNELTGDDQVVELKSQDILVSRDCGDYLLKISHFIDELLEKVYGASPYYHALKKEDLVGQLLIGLAPHTSAGVLARLIGFSRAAVGYAHPFFHAAKRRNCFHGDTVISVIGGKGQEEILIRDFIVRNFDVSRKELDRVGTYYSEPKEAFYTQSIDTQGGISLKRITGVSVHRSPATMITFGTERGKTITVTPDHSMLVRDEAYIRKIMAMEIKIGDVVPVFENGFVINDRISNREILPSVENYVYSLSVAGNHTLAANGIFTGQCDGDEDCVMLLMDGMINFSRAFLPETRGGFMDAPLVLTSRINPSEIDKEAHNLDIGDHYPLEVYEGAVAFAHPKELDEYVERVEKRLGTPGQYGGFMFTNPTSDISAGPLVSTYTSLGSMLEKLDAELDLAKKIRAVDVDDVAERVLNTHFIPDLMGNLNSYSRQTMRCTKCNSKYRRMPVSGKCTRCGKSLTPTVHEGSVKKYLEISRRLCDEYSISEYTRQRIEMLDMTIESTFGTPERTQLGLADFM